MMNEKTPDNMAEIKNDFQSPEDASNRQTNEIVAEVYDEMGIIGPETKIAGNIVTKGHVTVLGTVKGDISANGNVIIRGNVKGKILCDNLLLENSNLEADIDAKGQVSIKGGVTVKGQICCSSINVMGTVIGDIKAAEKIGLAETAVIKGNITASSLGTALGAKIDGKVSIG